SKVFSWLTSHYSIPVWGGQSCSPILVAAPLPGRCASISAPAHSRSPAPVWQAAAARLAARHRLTLYDAAYLELAKRRGLPLATLDLELRAAAAAERVTILGIGA